MTSGFGARGNAPGRCYSFWDSYYKCALSSDVLEKCFDFRDDYFECLHHKKESARLRAIDEQRQKQNKKVGILGFSMKKNINNDNNNINDNINNNNNNNNTKQSDLSSLLNNDFSSF